MGPVDARLLDSPIRLRVWLTAGLPHARSALILAGRTFGLKLCNDFRNRLGKTAHPGSRDESAATNQLYEARGLLTVWRSTPLRNC